MIDPSTPPPMRWRDRFKRLLTLARRALPFAFGVLAAFIALLLYNLLLPKPSSLPLNEVNDAVAQVLGSATPPPAFSARVYQVIQPSLVLIQAKPLTSMVKKKPSWGAVSLSMIKRIF